MATVSYVLSLKLIFFMWEKVDLEKPNTFLSITNTSNVSIFFLFFFLTTSIQRVLQISTCAAVFSVKETNLFWKLCVCLSVNRKNPLSEEILTNFYSDPFHDHLIR